MENNDFFHLGDNITYKHYYSHIDTNISLDFLIYIFILGQNPREKDLSFDVVFKSIKYYKIFSEATEKSKKQFLKVLAKKRDLNQSAVRIVNFHSFFNFPSDFYPG